MDAVRDYFLAVAAAAIICGIVTGLMQNKGTAYEIIRLIAGLFLALTVIRPIAQIDLSEISDFTVSYTRAADDAVMVGENLSHQAMVDIIKTQSEAYILDKAEALGLEVIADVTVSTDTLPVPVSVSISGSFSPYARKWVEKILTEELGIAKENQQWTG